MKICMAIQIVVLISEKNNTSVYMKFKINNDHYKYH